MPHYMIFNSGRRQDGLRWDNTPVGVFQADDAETACKAAAADCGQLGTFFAVEGYPWGVEMLAVEGVHKLGETELESARNRLREIERRVLENPLGLKPDEF